MNRRIVLALALATLIPLRLAGQSRARAMTVKLGTVAPKDSSFHRILGDMGNEWQAYGADLKIYAGGVRGGEAEMVQYMRTGALDAALITGNGLAAIDKSAEAMQSAPMLFRSLAEVDYTVAKLRPRIEPALRERGFVVLFWTDAGWVRFFTKQPILRPDDARRLKLFTWAGDHVALDLYKTNGFHPVALETNDILPALQTGMIEAVPMPPYVALTMQVSSLAPNMLAIDWAPLIGALVVTERCWNRFTPEQQREMARVAAAAGRQMKARNRRESDLAVEAMKKRNLRVTELPPDVAEEWRRVAEKTWPRLRGQKIPAELFDEMVRLLAEYRRRDGSAR